MQDLSLARPAKWNFPISHIPIFKDKNEAVPRSGRRPHGPQEIELPNSRWGARISKNPVFYAVCSTTYPTPADTARWIASLARHAIHAMQMTASRALEMLRDWAGDAPDRCTRIPHC